MTPVDERFESEQEIEVDAADIHKLNNRYYATRGVPVAPCCETSYCRPSDRNHDNRSE
jgi:hypothetical protein